MITESEKEILLKQSNSLMLNGKYEVWALEPFSDFYEDWNCRAVRSAYAKYRVSDGNKRSDAIVVLSWNGDLQKWSATLGFLRDSLDCDAAVKTVDIFSAECIVR